MWRSGRREEEKKKEKNCNSSRENVHNFHKKMLGNGMRNMLFSLCCLRYIEFHYEKSIFSLFHAPCK